jgi:hypothetical protein
VSQPRLAFTCVAFAIFCGIASNPALAQQPQPEPSAPPSTAACRIVDASLATPLNSRETRPGTVFQFNVSRADQGSSGVGYGVVNFVRGAKRGGVPGEIGLEARFVALSDGTHVPATLVSAWSRGGLVTGKNRNVPFPLGYAGLATPVAGASIGVYGFLHSGSQAVVPTGTALRVVLGDDYLTGACRVS